MHRRRSLPRSRQQSLTRIVAATISSTHPFKNKSDIYSYHPSCSHTTHHLHPQNNLPHILPHPSHPPTHPPQAPCVSGGRTTPPLWYPRLATPLSTHSPSSYPNTQTHSPQSPSPRAAAHSQALTASKGQWSCSAASMPQVRTGGCCVCWSHFAMSAGTCVRQLSAKLPRPRLLWAKSVLATHLQVQFFVMGAMQTCIGSCPDDLRLQVGGQVRCAVDVVRAVSQEVDGGTC
jgi:hypothetical protein